MTARLLALSALLLLFTASARGQASVSGSLRGRVSDAQGLPIPRALIQLTAGADRQQTAAGPDGEYYFPRLRPGRYSARVEAAGFRAALQEAVEIAGQIIDQCEANQGIRQ